MTLVPALNWAPRRILPAPTTTASWTPRSTNPLDLPGDVQGFIDADPALAAGAKTIPLNLSTTRSYFGFRFSETVIFHWFLCSREGGHEARKL